MIGDQILDTIQRYIDKEGFALDEANVYPEQLLVLFCNTASKVRSSFMVKEYEMTGKNYLASTIDRLQYADNPNWSYFKTAPAIMNSYEYLGAPNYGKRYRENRTISEWENTLKHQIPREVPEYFEQEGNIIVDDANIATIFMNFMPVNPFLVPTFNFYVDDFPIDDALVDDVIIQMFVGYKKLEENAAN